MQYADECTKVSFNIYVKRKWIDVSMKGEV